MKLLEALGLGDDPGADLCRSAISRRLNQSAVKLSNLERSESPIFLHRSGQVDDQRQRGVNTPHLRWFRPRVIGYGGSGRLILKLRKLSCIPRRDSCGASLRSVLRSQVQLVASQPVGYVFGHRGGHLMFPAPAHGPTVFREELIGVAVATHVDLDLVGPVVGVLPARTLMAHLGKDGYSHIHYDSGQARTITVREAAQLQSSPDRFEFCGTINPAFRQIGNAVAPLVALALARQFAANLELELLTDKLRAS